MNPTDRMLAQAKVAGTGTLPGGVYAGTLTEARVLRRKKDQAWVLKLIATLTQNERVAYEHRPLARAGDDPYLLSKHQQRTWREFIRRLDLPAGTVKEQIDALGALLGQEVSVEVKHAITGPQFTISKANGILYGNNNGALTTSGEILTVEDRTNVAHGAHVMLLEGLRAARLGLSAAAQACWTLSRESAWVDLGYDTLNAYLASPEISMSRSEFFRMGSIWEAYVLEGAIDPLELQAGEPSKLEVPLRAINDGEVSAREALDDVASLGRKDLREKYGQGDTATKTDGEQDAPKTCGHCGHTAEPSTQAIVYHGRTWPIWMTRDMIVAAVASTEKVAA